MHLCKSTNHPTQVNPPTSQPSILYLCTYTPYICHPYIYIHVYMSSLTALSNAIPL